jgi:hypothetical protein
MHRICGLDWLAISNLDDRQLINEGAVAEQFIGQHLSFNFSFHVRHVVAIGENFIARAGTGCRADMALSATTATTTRLMAELPSYPRNYLRICYVII